MTNREIDALVAENVMGWKNISFDHERTAGGIAGFGEHKGFRMAFPPYSTSIEAAWEVVEELGDVIIERDETARGTTWKVVVDGIETFADTAPTAICIAALKAVGVNT